MIWWILADIVEFVRDVLCYWLALLITILEIILFTSVIFIPLVLVLRDRFEIFKEPFKTARYM